MSTKESFFSFYKVKFGPMSNGNAMCDCPFCEKSKKLGIVPETGQFKCWSCGVKGNHLGFITQLHQHYLEKTTDEHYKQLQKERGIPSEVFKNAGFAYSETHGLWYVPYAGPGEHLSNLGVFNPSSPIKKQRYRIYKGPDLKQSLYKPFTPKNGDGGEVYVCEGEWDALAMYAIFRHAKQPPPTIVALPGAEMYKEEFNAFFKGKSVIYFFDHDDAGRRGEDRVRKLAQGHDYAFASFNTIENDFDLDTVNDVRALLLTIKTKAKALSFIQKMASEADIEEAPPQSVQKTGEYATDVDDIDEVPSHSVFIKTLKGLMYTNQYILEAYELCMSAALSVIYPGEPIWIFLFGPPSSGKTKLIEAFGGINKYFQYTSKLTPESFVSGWRGAKTFLELCFGKTLCIKDLTVILGMAEQIQQRLWDIFRDSYDGSIRIPFGNGEERVFTGFKYNIIAGVTKAIHRFNDSDMGSRFLKVDFLGPDFDENAHMDAAEADMADKAAKKQKMLEITLGRYKYLHENAPKELSSLPETPQAIKDQLKALAKLLAKVRGQVDKDRIDGIKYRPETEVATRIYLQLIMFIRCLAYVRGKDEVDENCYNSIRRVVFSSCPELSFEVVDYIHRKGVVTRKDIVSDLKLPTNRVNRIIEDFHAMELVEKVRSKQDDEAGASSYQYSLTENLSLAFDTVRTKSKSNVKRSSKTSSKTSKVQVSKRGGKRR